MSHLHTPFLLAAVLLVPVLPPLPAQQPGAQPEPAVAVAEGSAAVQPVLDEATAAAIRREGIENSQAMRLLQDLTGRVGHRLTGSDNFTKACDWAVAEFERMGLSNVHKEKWGEWRLVWNRGVVSGRIVRPIELEMYVAIPAWTPGTDGPVVVPLVAAPADAEAARKDAARLEGAWIFGIDPGERIRDPEERAARQELVEACEQAGIAAFVFAAQGSEEYPERVRVFGSHRTAMGELADVPKILQVAVRSDHAAKLAELLAAGKDVECEFRIEAAFREGPIELHNVIAEIPGTKTPDEVVIVCGHLDSWHQAQGCTDNGTGTTSTMEAARILAAVGAKPDRTIRFCLWGGEEQGLLGSRAYVQMHRSEMDKVSAVFNHDTGTNWAAALTVAETMYGPLQRVFAPAMALSPPDEDHQGPVFELVARPTISGGGGSDHASFLAAGVPGLNWSLTGRSDYFGYTWHSQWDTIDVAIPEYQRHTSTVIALAALGTANLPELLDRSGVVRRSGRGQSGMITEALFGAEMDGLKFTKVNEGGRAATMGIQAGDTLVKVNGEAIERLFDIFRIARGVDEGTESLQLELARGEQTVKAELDMSVLRNMSPGRRGGDRGRGRGGRGGEGEGQGGQRGGGGEGQGGGRGGGGR